MIILTKMAIYKEKNKTDQTGMDFILHAAPQPQKPQMNKI